MRRHVLTAISAVAAGVIVAAAARADIPWDGRTTRQQAALVLGYLAAEETNNCAALADEVTALFDALNKGYKFDDDDRAEKSALGRFVTRGRKAAEREWRRNRAGFCDDLKLDMDRARAELLRR